MGSKTKGWPTCRPFVYSAHLLFYPFKIRFFVVISGYTGCKIRFVKKQVLNFLDYYADNSIMHDL
jgi:hypothetical protein